MVITETGPTLRESDIVDLEREVQRTLPADYRAFLLTYNGGVPRDASSGKLLHVRVNATRPRDRPPLTDTDVRILFGLTAEYSTDLRLRREVVRDALPEDALAFGCDSAGNLFCLKLAGVGAGSTYLWDHETGFAVPLSAHFNEFLNQLHLR